MYAFKDEYIERERERARVNFGEEVKRNTLRQK